MGIDRIGKGGTPPVDIGGAAGGVDKVAPATPFSVDAPQAAAPTNAVDPASPLGKLRAGEIDVDGYVDAKVDEATKGIDLPPTDMADLKALLREQLVSDPSLADLVNHSTGHSPTPREE